MVKRVTTAVKKSIKATENRQPARTSSGAGSSKSPKSKPASQPATPQLKKSSAPRKAEAVKPKPVSKSVPKGQNGSVNANGRNGSAANGRNGSAAAATLVGTAKLAASKLSRAKSKADKTKPAPKTEIRRTLFNTRPAGVLAAARAAASRTIKAVEASQRKTPGLTKDELVEFRQMLLDKRREIVDDIANLEGEARRINTEIGSTSSTMPIHMADLGSDTWEQEFTLNLIEKQRTIIREIDEALDRVAAGQYGICLATGRPITKARLRAKPWAKYCIEYAQKRDRGLA